MMKKIFLNASILLFALSCKAQSTISLEEAATFRKTPDGIPTSVAYVKDTNNKLDQFIGTWKGAYNGKNYEIKFEKKLQFGKWNIKWDQLIGRILVKDNSGNIVYNSMNLSDDDTHFFGKNFQGNTYDMQFIGNYDCLESGSVFIATKPTNLNEMTLFYAPDTDGLLIPEKCPNYSTYVVLLPYDKMTLTKQ